MSRTLALLLSVLGGAAVALALMMFATGALVGLLWLFVFGDDEWPDWAMSVLNILIPTIGLLLWAIASRQVWLRLKRYL